MPTPDSDEFFVGPEEFDDNVRDEKGIISRFYIEPAVDPKASAEAGFDVFADAEWVEINRAGDRLSKFVCKVAKEHKERFPKAYRRFRAGVDQTKTGVPLEEWPIATRSMVAQWKACNIFSVEDLAACADDVLPRLGIDGLGYRAKAAAWLKGRKESGAASKLAADSAKKDQKIAALERSLSELNAKLEGFMADDAEHQGRKTLTLSRPSA